MPYLKSTLGENILRSWRKVTPVVTLPRNVVPLGQKAGFTMVEVVVMLSIITLVSGVVLVSFTGLSEGGALNRAAKELVLAIRKTQNMALAITQVGVGEPPTLLIAPAIGIMLNAGTSGYQIFADLETRNNKYDDPAEKIGNTQSFEGGVKIGSMSYYDTFGNPQPVSKVHIISISPEANMFISDVDGLNLNDKLDINIITSSGKIKKIIVRSSGQVSIK